MAAQEYYNGANSFNSPQQQHAAPGSTANYPVQAPPRYQPYAQQGQHGNMPFDQNEAAFSQEQKPIYPHQQYTSQPQTHPPYPQQQYPIQSRPQYPQQPHLQNFNPGEQYPSQPQPYLPYQQQQQQNPSQSQYGRPGPQEVRFEDDAYDASSEEEREPGGYSHLRPSRSYSEPPYHHHHHHHRHGHHQRSPSPYSSRSHSRSHSRERARNRNVDIARGSEKRHHSSTGTFLGAFGGGALGDAIFPGLGTLGGALLGGYGGHEVGKGKLRNKRGGSERPREHGRRGHRYRDTYEEEYEEGKRRRGEI